MKKNYVKVSLFLLLVSLLPMQSCIGSFSLTNKVLSWNNQVGSKFLNELVFFAFWILPVYEVTALADILVINSIEFWSGNNPVEAYNKVIETNEGKYYIACDEKGYEIISPNGEKTVLLFNKEEQTWNIKLNSGEDIPFMSFVDDSHVKMILPDGNFKEIELSRIGVMAYTSEIAISNPTNLNINNI